MTDEERRLVWVAWSNTDCTEGRGFIYPYAVAESYEAAFRLGLGRNVQGSNCDVTEEVAVPYGRHWLVPGIIQRENKDDKQKREAREKRESALTRARDLGLSDDDLQVLMG